VRDYARVYGLVDAADAARYGYQAPPTPTPTKPRGNHGPALSIDATELATVLSGWPGGKVGDLAQPPASVSVRGKAVPTGGCAAQAVHGLGLADNESPGETDLVRSIADGASHQAEADARVAAAFAEWSKCMKDKGFSYKTPWDPGDKTWPKPAGADEISTATADVACKRQVNLVATWYAVEVAYENALIQRNLSALTEEKAHNDALAAKASQILSEGVG
jgi:hypothetical protein